MRKFLYALLSCSALWLTLACSSGGSGSHTTIPSTAPQITTQPVSQTTSVGTLTTFSVVANGTSPLSYQWYWNGAGVAGATASSFTTPSAVSADNGSAFAVAVTNTLGTVISDKSILTIIGAPRSPLPGDLRFKDVDAFPFGLSPMNPMGQIIANALSMSAKFATCSPINLAWFDPKIPHSNAWDFVGFSLPSGYPERDISGTSGSIPSLDSDLSALNPQTVITSLDIDSDTQVYGMTWIKKPDQQTYTAFRQAVPLSSLQAAATQAGTQGQVITAISFLNGQPYFVAYTWSGDLSSQYDVQVAQATLDSIETTVANLSASGYIITAMGGNFTDGYLFVGTRIKGDTTPRPASVIQSTPWFLGRGYSPVGWIIVNGGSSYISIGQQ